MALWQKLYKHLSNMWVVVTIVVPFWIPNIMRHLIFRVPQKGAWQQHPHLVKHVHDQLDFVADLHCTQSAS